MVRNKSYYSLIREEAANVHISVADFCLKQLQKMGKDVIMLKDLEVKPEDIVGKDLLISLGILVPSNYLNRRRWNLFACKWDYLKP